MIFDYRHPELFGIEIAGAPFGSTAYTKAFLNSKVDTIIDELGVIENLLDSPDCALHNRLQVMYSIIRLCFTQQFMYHLRTSPPCATKNPAIRLDKAIVKTVNTIMHISPAELSSLSDEDRRHYYARLFSPIRIGGSGMTMAFSLKEIAFLSSWALVAPIVHQHIPQILPSIYFTDLDMDFSRYLRSATTKLADLGIEAFTPDDLARLNNGQKLVGRQRQLTARYNSILQAEMVQHLPTGSGHLVPCSNRASLTPDDKAVFLQGLANTNKHTGFWLSANPCYFSNCMQDKDFRFSFRTRNYLSVLGNVKYCGCGAKLDILAQHLFVCPQLEIRNQIRNPSHAILKHALVTAGRGYLPSGATISASEPLARLHFPARREQSAEKRADILISFNNDDGENTATDVLVDVTIAAPNRSNIDITKYAPGDAALARDKEKMAAYNRDFDLTGNPNAELVIFAAETTGSLTSVAKAFCKRLAQMADDPGIALGNILRTIGVAMQVNRAHYIREALRKYGTTEVSETLKRSKTYPNNRDLEQNKSGRFVRRTNTT